jgi:membrane associated rhomboid family serine protease
LLPLKDNIPTRDFPVVTVLLVAANIAVFILFQQALFGPNGGFNSAGKPDTFVHYSFIPYELSNPGDECDPQVNSAGDVVDIACEGQPGVSGTPAPQPPVWITIFTSMFMHAGVLHIAGNLLFLWIFGNNIEDSMGRLKFILFYLGGGLAAVAAQYVSDAGSSSPMLGASGAIAGVLGGYALLYPRARVVTLVIVIFFITIITLPALLVLGIWFLLQLLDAANQSGTEGGVAVWAHIGGFVFGLLAIKLFASRYDPDYDRPQRLPVW